MKRENSLQDKKKKKRGKWIGLLYTLFPTSPLLFFFFSRKNIYISSRGRSQVSGEELCRLSCQRGKKREK